MQIVEIELEEGYPFYCPITGELIVSEQDFTPSPAMFYCYIKNDSLFEYTNSLPYILNHYLNLNFQINNFNMHTFICIKKHPINKLNRMFYVYLLN